MKIGEKIVLNNEEYLILDILNDDTLKLMSTERINVRRNMDSVRQYEERELDLFLNEEYYLNLPFKDKILETEIDQSIFYKSENGEINIKGLGTFAKAETPIAVLERKIFAPSIEDFAKLPTQENVIDEYLGKESFSLRDAYPKTRKGSWGIQGNIKKAEFFFCREYISTKPVFCIKI